MNGFIRKCGQLMVSSQYNFIWENNDDTRHFAVLLQDKSNILEAKKSTFQSINAGNLKSPIHWLIPTLRFQNAAFSVFRQQSKGTHAQSQRGSGSTVIKCKKRRLYT